MGYIFLFIGIANIILWYKFYSNKTYRDDYLKNSPAGRFLRKFISEEKLPVIINYMFLPLSVLLVILFIILGVLDLMGKFDIVKYLN